MGGSSQVRLHPFGDGWRNHHPETASPSGQATPGEGAEGGVEGFGLRAEKGGAEEVSVAGAHFGV